MTSQRGVVDTSAVGVGVTHQGGDTLVCGGDNKGWGDNISSKRGYRPNVS